MRELIGTDVYINQFRSMSPEQQLEELIANGPEGEKKFILGCACLRDSDTFRLLPGFEKVISFNDFVQEVSCSNISQKQFDELEATYTTYKEYSDRMYPYYVTTIVSYCLNNRSEIVAACEECLKGGGNDLSISQVRKIAKNHHKVAREARKEKKKRYKKEEDEAEAKAEAEAKNKKVKISRLTLQEREVNRLHAEIDIRNRKIEQSGRQIDRLIATLKKYKSEFVLLKKEREEWGEKEDWYIAVIYQLDDLNKSQTKIIESQNKKIENLRGMIRQRVSYGQIRRTAERTKLNNC